MSQKTRSAAPTVIDTKTLFAMADKIAAEAFHPVTYIKVMDGTKWACWLKSSLADFSRAVQDVVPIPEKLHASTPIRSYPISEEEGKAIMYNMIIAYSECPEEQKGLLRSNISKMKGKLANHPNQLTLVVGFTAEPEILEE
jgi:hypothetical protein